MTNAQNAFRSLFAYVFLVPTALALGYLLATSNVGPNIELSSLAPFIFVFGLLSVPLLLKWHQALLLVTLNMTAVLFFLPGSPQIWFGTAALSFAMALGHRALDRETRFVHAPSIVRPLLFLMAVVILTGYLTGGFGVRIFGSGQYGGRRYLFIFVAIAAFFAIIARPIPQTKALAYVGLFFLGGIANTMSNVIPLLPRELYWLAWIFPVSGNDMGALAFQGRFGEGIARFLGLTSTGCCAFYYLMARYGIADTLGKPWRFFLLIGVLVLSTFGGFRSALLILGLTFLFVFYFEGLFRTKYAGIILGFLVLVTIALVPLANKLPLSVQRTLTILPLDLNPIARYEAQGSSEWRIDMWKLLLPEVPKYLLVPKGLGINGAEMDLTGELVARGQLQTAELAILAGDYHNGPLSILIPFGIWGFIVWLWFLAASIRALWLNYRHGAESLRKINTLLLASFLTQTVMFFVVFGAFFSEVVQFVSLIGLSLSLNNGICKPAVQTLVAEPEPILPVSAPA